MDDYEDLVDALAEPEFQSIKKKNRDLPKHCKLRSEEEEEIVGVFLIYFFIIKFVKF